MIGPIFILFQDWRFSELAGNWDETNKGFEALRLLKGSSHSVDTHTLVKNHNWRPQLKKKTSWLYFKLYILQTDRILGLVI